MDKLEPIFLLDTYGLIYRSYFAFVSRPLTNSKGCNVSAVFGFFKSLHHILKEYQPSFFIAALDSITPTFRHNMYAEYKATREKTPEDLHAQIPIIEEILKELGLPVLRCNGFEADDIIASAAAAAKKENRECFIISGDKDLMQLVDGNTYILKAGKTETWEKADVNEVEKIWGVPPSLMLDLLSLTGDTADNIPGVKGIGPKTAVKLLTSYGSLDGIYENIQKIKGAIQKNLAAGQENAYFSKNLITLSYEVPISPLSEYKCSPIHFEKAGKIFFREEIPSLAKLYGGENNETNDKSVTAGIKRTTGVLTPLEKISINLGIEEKPENKGDYSFSCSASTLFDLIDKGIQQGFIAFDCETTGLDTMTAELAGFSLSIKEGSGCYFPLKAPEPQLLEQSYEVLAFDTAKEALHKLFNSNAVVIMHNAKFDYKIIKHLGIIEKTETGIFDTMIAAWLLDPDRMSFSIDSLAESLLGVKTIPYNTVVAKNELFTDVPLEKAGEYASEDADIALRLYSKLKPLLFENNLDKLFYDVEMPLLLLLSEMELTGIYLDKEELISFSKALAEEIEEKKADIFSIVGHEFNIASPKQLQDVLFTERKLTPDKKTKTGYSTDTTVLEKLAAEDPVPAKILEYRALTKLKSAYADALPALTSNDGRIHTSFIQSGTATGRLSSKDPNLQNIPVKDENGKKIRRAFHAGKGKLLISSDYSQIELVLLAHLSQDKNLTSAFLNGTDVHKHTACLIFGTQMDDVTEEMRRIAKIVNFGVMYGMSAFRLANALQIQRTQAAEFIKTYFAMYSGVSAFMEGLREQAADKGYVETIMGRRRYIKAINSTNKLEKAGAERVAVNTVIQGSAADIVKLAMLKVDAAVKKAGFQADILLQVHDELILECPKSEVLEVKEIVKKQMESILKLSVPLKADIAAGENWGSF